MPLTLDTVRGLQAADAEHAWATIFDEAWRTCSSPIDPAKAQSEVTNRERALSSLDLFLATTAWDLWHSYEAVVPRTSALLKEWWPTQESGRAILILDALSLREAPWIIDGAKQRGYAIHQARPSGAEIPADTTPFAKALGFAQRSALENNAAGKSHSLQGACTDCVELPWIDCVNLIGSEPSWVLWHKWPDHRLHDLDDPGEGLSALTKEVAERLTDEDFWKLIERLSTGRRLVITADHGYAATGHYSDTSDKELTSYLKARFRSRRWTPVDGQDGTWLPPIDLALSTAHGENHLVVGRRKWKSQGGYPTLTHGGLSILEVAVPFIEISKP